MQNDRNTFLASEIKKLDKDIADINELKNQIQALLARKQIIETLQADRAQTVHLLEQTGAADARGRVPEVDEADRARRCTSSATRSRTRASRR